MRECGAGDHVADFGEGGVGAEAHAGSSQAHPDRAAAVLNGACQRAIVDDLAADCGQAADALESFAAQKDAASRGPCGASVWIGDPPGRIEFEEEIEEGWDEGALG